MATGQVLMKIGILIVSFLIGIIFFYVLNPTEKAIKKKQVEQVGSQLINFVIFIWVGKILFNGKLFVQDPLAVLAYPSDSKAFYIATILFLGTLSYQVIRKKLDITLFITSFIPVFLAASFAYEFIQLVYNNAAGFLYLGLLMVLLILYTIALDKQLIKHQLFLFGLWGTGQFILSFMLPYVTSFDYLLSRYFFLGIVVLCIAIYVFNNRKKVF